MVELAYYERLGLGLALGLGAHVCERCLSLSPLWPKVTFQVADLELALGTLPLLELDWWVWLSQAAAVVSLVPDD